MSLGKIMEICVVLNKSGCFRVDMLNSYYILILKSAIVCLFNIFPNIKFYE